MVSRSTTGLTEIFQFIIVELKNSINGDFEQKEFSLGDRIALILLYAHAFRMTEKEEFLNFVEDQIQNSYSIIQKQEINFTLSGGFTGFLWVLNRLVKMSLLEKNILIEVKNNEKYIIQSIDNDFESRNYDLLYGFIGKGIFFLENEHSLKRKAVLEKIIDVLDAIAIKDNDGITWIDEDFNESPTTPRMPVINLGLAHGVPSILSFVSKVYTAGIRKEKSKKLIINGIKWLLANKNSSKDSMYNSFIGSNEDNTRLGWCYGDLSVSMALMQAYNALREEVWLKEAINIGIHSAQRNLINSGVVQDNEQLSYDKGFCHGTAGLAHMYQRLFQATNKLVFKSSADYWLDLTLTNMKGQSNSKFYFPYYNEATNKLAWDEDVSILTGTTGVCLSLLTFIEKNQTTWDSILMTDIA